MECLTILHLMYSRGFADYDGKGILLRNYDHDREVRLTWSAVDKRLDRLVENGQYLTALELEEYRKLEQEYGAPLPGAFKQDQCEP